MLKISRWVLLISALCSSGASVADIDKLKSLVDQAKYEEAYDYANQLMDTLEGVPAFDLQYAIAAIDTGRLSEGVFALERVLLLDSQNNLARLELARGLYFLEKYSRAKRLFEQVKTTAPPEKVRQRINQYLSLIDKKTLVPPTKFNSFVELMAGYDDNINTGPEEQASLVTLTDAALGRGDQYIQFKVGGRVDHHYTPDKAIYISSSMGLRQYETESEENYASLSASVGHRWLGEKDQWQLGGVFQKYNLDGSSYRNLLGVNGNWNRQLSAQTMLRSHLAFYDLSYSDSEWKDASLLSYGADLLYLASGDWRPVYFVGVFGGREKPEESGVVAGAEISRDFVGVKAGFQFKPVAKLNFMSSLLFQNSEYQGRHWIYGKNRDDDYFSLDLKLDWMLTQQWKLLAGYRFSRTDSNIEIYDYDRQQIHIGIGYSF